VTHVGLLPKKETIRPKLDLSYNGEEDSLEEKKLFQHLEKTFLAKIGCEGDWYWT